MRAGLRNLPHPARWALLLALSALMAALLALFHLAAAFMLGPMAAGIALALSENSVSIPKPLFSLAQATLGCLIAQALTLPVLVEIRNHLPLFLFGVLSVILLSFSLGWALARFRIVPGTTALWGASPGAGSAMILMCGSFGADARLVAFMIYLRVMLIALLTSTIAHVFTSHSPVPAPLAHPQATPLWPTLALILTTMAAARILPRLPAAPLLLAMICATFLQDTRLLTLHLPHPVLICAYAIVGWSIGLRFTLPIIRHAARMFPAVLLSTLILIAGCALLAFPVAHFAHTDFISAYLATSPGGADSIAIIAASTPVNVPFVMAMQTARFMMVLLLAPLIARPLGRALERQLS